MKILACGDVHLTNYSLFNRLTTDQGIGSRLSIILHALSYFFAYGKDNNINVFIINGDLFDKRQSENPSVMAYMRKHLIRAYRSIAPDGSLLILNVGKEHIK